MADNKKRTSNFHIAKGIITNSSIITEAITDDIFIYRDGIYIKADIYLKKKIQDNLQEQTTTNSVNEILNHIRRMTYKPEEELNKTPVNLICVKNGILDLDNKKKEDFNSDYIFFNKLNVAYVKGAACTKFKQFLGSIINKDDISFVKRMIGISLIRDARYHKSLMLYGKGGEGKSTLLKTIIAFLGKENCSNMTLQQLGEDMFAPIQINGKLANICPDIPMKGLKNSSIFKGIVSGDRLTARNLHKPYISFTPYTKLMFSANKIPKTYDLSDAFFDRWVLITFKGKNFRDTGEAIENYEDIFISNPQEMSGILNWAIEGIIEAEIFGFCDVKDIKSKWLRYSDSIYSYKHDCLMSGNENDFIVKQDLYKNYLKYCRKHNIMPNAENSFHLNLIKIMDLQECNPKIDGKQVKAWRYLSFKKRIW